jgi:hypothetical protein
MPQKKQVELNLGTGGRGEAPSAAAPETEARAARTDIEGQAALVGQAIVERENLKKALAQVKRNKNKGAAAVDRMSVDVGVAGKSRECRRREKFRTCVNFGPCKSSGSGCGAGVSMLIWWHALHPRPADRS